MTELPPDIARQLLAETDKARSALTQLEATIRAAAGMAPHALHEAAAPAVADDADLDSEWGNPQVRKNPPRWQGQDCAGLKYSDCPPDFLDTLAGFLDWQAGKADEKNETLNNGKPRSMYLRKDAARARGHAARIRAKAAPRRPTNPTGRGSMNEPDEDVPF